MLVRIGSRGSRLALTQAELAGEVVRGAGHDVAYVPITTAGDRDRKSPFGQIGERGVFVKEIEEAMLRGEIDIAVHSMKDVPTIFPEGLALRCITEREDPRDIVILRPGFKSFRDLPQGARIGTSSLRRKAALLHLRPDFVMVDIRGNVETRIRKLTGEGLAAGIPAAAGMKGLGFADQIGEYLPVEISLPAIGQGALGLESRIDDAETNVRCVFPDNLLPIPVNRTLGLVVAGDDGQHFVRYGSFGQANSPRSFGHAGAHMHVGWADPATGPSFCYLTNGRVLLVLREHRRTTAVSSLAAVGAA